MRFLGTKQDAVLELLRRGPDDDRAAEELVRRSGRTPQECATWSKQFLRKQRLLLALLDADEGRWPPDWRAAAVRWLYNRVLMPPLSWLHRNDPNRRLGRGV